MKTSIIFVIKPHSIPEAPSFEVQGCKGCSEGKLFWEIFYHFVMLESLGCWDLVSKNPTRLAHLIQTKRCSSEMPVKPPIVWGKLTADCWLQLDNTVHSKLTNSGTLSERLIHLESTILLKLLSCFVIHHHQITI